MCPRHILGYGNGLFRSLFTRLVAEFDDWTGKDVTAREAFVHWAHSLQEAVNFLVAANITFCLHDKAYQVEIH